MSANLARYVAAMASLDPETVHSLGADFHDIDGVEHYLGNDGTGYQLDENFGAEDDVLRELMMGDVFAGEGMPPGFSLDEMGADVFAADVFGADPRAVALAKAKKAAALRAKIRPMERELILPIPTQTIPAGGNRIIQVSPQLYCRINRVVIPSNIGQNFEIQDITVGTRSQFVAPGAVSGVACSEVAQGMALKGDTAGFGIFINVSVNNLDLVNPQDFRGSYFKVFAVVR